ncbi:uncharacterized protein LOC105430458 [Pogonomyrmex barbatus]|uniref:Uncharacterized protein LOC105430458 n=1 Tax=Pogonomyrmex barbatus TaxID=144034 RepID=A0A6I9WLA6_9HYME|nr:uncharacterized protein LOC105430458 [Pogonomyrmex barbatus]XP_011642334.1 uncharacterized protein LOC105430458 [Pogonomyrmex barbatus]XP_011642335.1 uncharacterized protein LOC105430458 [Pogonomyrmex barbatus]XP_011642336.1 uncharacterized protein LOC105430458 [Pogonomyrmex barbatus]XP_011642337.1 uncharacterized protein LOC105430458 [Pogonomyrmex barbatus]
MPGIHVRTLSQLDWLDQEKESLLTIPGSYWLCHKKNIYKFIFRYHRTMKNTMQFSYGRELLKIIRRIIKCNPTQGQQFGTQHLLVTYNCTSWTRQDKMFAILKFQQRTNAAAFSHAFVLTIKIYPSEHSLFDLKYPIVKEAGAGSTFKDLNVPLDTEEKIDSTITSAIDKVSSSKTICQTKKIDQISKYNSEIRLNETTINSNFQNDNIKDSTIFHDSTDKKIESATTITEAHFDNRQDTEFYNTRESKSTNCNSEKWEKKIEQHSLDSVQEQQYIKANKINIEIKKEDTSEGKETQSIIIQKQELDVLDIQNYEIFSSLKPLTEIKKDNANESLLSNKLNFDKKLIEKDCIHTINNKINLDNKEMINKDIVNSSNVLYQHVIEKEIETAEHNLTVDETIRNNLQTEIKNINKDYIPNMKISNKSEYTKQRDYCNEITDIKSKENDKRHTNILMDIDDKQSQNNMYNKLYKARKQKSRESERKIVPDKVMRSSNITDLVMEGLMFTIRQDQDSVAVIEQKTKLEMDEVLENSEKVETEAGGKCLLNSSLLRLENLITMIDSPRNKDDQHKNPHEINGANLLPCNVFPSDTVYNVDINYVKNYAKMDKSSISYDRCNANHLNLYQSQWQNQCVSSSIKNNNNCFSEMEWQNNDNKQDEKFKNDIEMRKQEKGIIPEKIDKYDQLMTYYSPSLPYSPSNIFLNPSKMSTKNISITSEESSLIKLPQQKTNIPRIISDKTITIEQMPSALQKVLRHKTNRFPSTICSEALQHEQKVQNVTLTDSTNSEIGILSEEKFVASDIADLSTTKFSIDSEKINDERSCVINKDAAESDRNIHVKNSTGENKIPHTLQRDLSSKHGLPRKLQDITEEFYYDLLHIHNKDNAIRQKCLRQKQKSLNNLDNIKNGKVRIEMLKFIQDITDGARVVVTRLNINNKSNSLGKNSNLI